jgi:hypothetical protein
LITIPGLKDKTIDYIVVNHPIVCKGSDDNWREFSDKYPGLVREIVDEIARKSIITSFEYKCKYKTRIIKNNSTNSQNLSLRNNFFIKNFIHFP